MPATDQPLNLQIACDNEGVRISLQGELDASTAPDLLVLLQDSFAQRPSELVIDLSDVEFIDSSGLSVLVTARKRAQNDGVKFLLSRPGPHFRKLLQITALTDYFNFD